MPTLGAIGANTVVGLTHGSVFALLAIGIVLVYRVTGVLNFAHGAMGMFSTFVAWQMLYAWKVSVVLPGLGWDLSTYVATLVALLFSLLLGLILEFGIFHWLVGRPQLIKAVVTIGVLLALQSIATIIWGNNAYHFPIKFPGTDRGITVFEIPVGYDKLLVIFAALALAAGLAAFLRYTRIGLAMRAVSDDPVAAELWGVSVWKVGALSWMLGSLVAAIAGILITPFINFDTYSLTVLVLDALAAALIGGLVSLPLTVAGGFALGLLETYPYLWIKSLGFPKLVALVVILVVLLVRSQRGLLAPKA